MNDHEALICALLRGEQPTWPSEDDATAAEFLAACATHGVEALVSQRLGACNWPPAITEALKARRFAWAAWDGRHQAFLRDVLRALHDAGITALLFKGAALAPEFYASPELRPRSDSDVLVPPQCREVAARVLAGLGLKRIGEVESEFVGYECSFRRDEAGLMHTLDLHWRVHYSQWQAARVHFDGLWERSSALHIHGLPTRAAGRVDALVLACLHRANDLKIPQWNADRAGFGVDRLIAFYDIHLIVGRLSVDETESFLEIARRTGTVPLCADALLLCARFFHDDRAAALALRLDAAGSGSDIARYHAASGLQRRWMDFRAVSGVVRKIRFVREHLLPSRAVLLERHPGEPGASAFRLHARRWTYAVRRWWGAPAEFRWSRVAKSLGALGHDERLVLVEAAIAYPIVHVALRLCGVQRIRRALERSAERTPAMPLDRARAVARLVAAASRLMPWSVSCLERSLVLHRLMRRRGAESELVIGVARDGERFDAHAWIEYRGVPINDREGVARQYAAFELPPANR